MEDDLKRIVAPEPDEEEKDISLHDGATAGASNQEREDPEALNQKESKASGLKPEIDPVRQSDGHKQMGVRPVGFDRPIGQ